MLMFEYGVHLHSFHLKTGQSCEQCFLLLVLGKVVNQVLRVVSVGYFGFVGVVFTGVITRFAEVS